MDAIVEPVQSEIDAPTKYTKRFIASRWLKVCSQCERPLYKGRGPRRVGLARFFCGRYCQTRYFGGFPSEAVSSVQNQAPPNAPPEAETGLLTTSIAFPLVICPGWQVIDDGLQWMLQRWREPQWRNESFCRTRAGLEQSIRELVGREHEAAVTCLPSWHSDVAHASEPPTPLEAVSSPETSPAEDQHSPRLRRLRNGLINGIFADEAELAAYQRGLQGDYQLEYYDDGFPKLPDCLRRIFNG
jgi:hypothetical protein